MVSLNINAAFIKQFKDFYYTKETRWILKETICIKKRGDTCVEFASTDGQKLLVISRPLEDTEQMDDSEYIVPVGNLPLKGKYLSYTLTIEDNIACFFDGVNKYKFPLIEGKYPDYRKLIEDARYVVEDALDDVLSDPKADWATIKNAIKDNLSDYIWSEMKRRPVIIPIITEVE